MNFIETADFFAIAENDSYIPLLFTTASSGFNFWSQGATSDTYGFCVKKTFINYG